MNEKIMKPMSVARQDFIEQLVNDVNNCGLPMFVIEPILQDLLSMVKASVQQQYEVEKEQYEKQMASLKEGS